MKPWHLLSKLNKDKNLSSPLEDGTEMKIKEYDPQIPPSPVKIPPLHLYAPHNHFHFQNQLVKETQSSRSSPVCPLSLWKRILAEINSHCTFLTFLVSFWILSCDEVRTSNAPRTVVLEMLKGRWGNMIPLTRTCSESFRLSNVGLPNFSPFPFLYSLRMGYAGASQLVSQGSGPNCNIMVCYFPQLASLIYFHTHNQNWLAFRGYCNCNQTD